MSTYYLEYGCHVARLRRRRRNTASHDNHEKINSWVCFSFPYEYGAPLGGPSGRRSSAIICNFCQHPSKHFSCAKNLLVSKSLVDALSSLLPVGQARRESYLPKRKLYLSRTSDGFFFRALNCITRMLLTVARCIQRTWSDCKKGLIAGFQSHAIQNR